MTPQPPENRDKDAGRWSDLSRPPLNATALRRALVRPGALWTSLDVVPATGSTNSDLAARAAEGKAEEGAVLVAEEQSAGRGRLNRTWSAPPRSGIFVSVYLTPRPHGTLGLAPAAHRRRHRHRPLEGGRNRHLPQVAQRHPGHRPRGLLLRRRSGRHPRHRRTQDRRHPRRTGRPRRRHRHRPERLPRRRRTPRAHRRLAGPGGRPHHRPRPAAARRAPLTGAVVRHLAGRHRRPRHQPSPGDLRGGLRHLGRSVRAELPGDTDLTGEAVAIDGDGRLVLATANGVRHPVGAGDIIHLRATAQETGGDDSAQP